MTPQIYCKNCYSYTHGHKSKANLHDADCSQLQGEEGEADVCPRCSGKVSRSFKCITPSPTRCLRLRSRLRSQGATTGSVSPAPSANTRWTQPTLPTDLTTRCQRFCSHLSSPSDAQIYCVHCYELIHGKKAKTKSMPLDTTSIMGEAELGTCPRCSGKVFSK